MDYIVITFYYCKYTYYLEPWVILQAESFATEIEALSKYLRSKNIFRKS